jgi:MFS family permease
MRQFRRLWIAATVDAFGSWLLVTAVPVHVYTLTGSATSTSLALAIEAAPAVLLGPWAGVVIDRFPRGTVLVLANLAAAAGVAIMLLATAPGRIWCLYTGLVVQSVAVCFVRPALRAATPAVVADGSALASANAALAVSGSVWRIAGPLIGTALAAMGWFAAVVLLDVASYLAAAAIIASLSIPPGGPANGAARVRDGLRHIAGTPVLRGLLASSCLYWTANAALTALLMPFVVHRLHASGRAVGYLITGLGIGYLCGSAMSRRLLVHVPARTLVTAAYATVGLCFLVMFASTSVPVAVAAAAGSGLPGAAAVVATGHHLQLATPDHALGRVSAAFHTSDAIAAVGGALTAPAVVALAGLGPGLLALSTVVLVAAVLAAALVPGNI